VENFLLFKKLMVKRN
jgi:hypothetical protein